jgi:hypothetical protein
MAQIYYLPRPAAVDMTDELVVGLVDLIASMKPSARADLMAFVHLIEDPSLVEVALDVTHDGQVRVTLSGRG